MVKLQSPLKGFGWGNSIKGLLLLVTIPVINDISKLKTEDNYDDIQFNNEVERRLSEFVNNNKSE